MKSFKPNVIAITLSITIAIIVSVISALVDYLIDDPIWHYAIIFVASTAVVFSISAYFLGIFITNKLKPLFKVIRDVPLEKTQSNISLKPDMDVTTEVSLWATNKQEEIKRLQDLEQYRKEFVGNVSHELKTPIFNIQGYILTLIEGGIDDPRINMLYLKRTVKSIDRMISIVEDLESINKLESGELKLKKENFDIIKLVDDVFEIEHMIAKERKITLEFASQYENPILVYADKKRIMEVVSNLVVNGIKYGKKSGFVSVGFFDMDDHIMVEVSDNGIGIDKEHIHRVFERFYRIDKHRSREQGGTGLGLSIVKHIIEAHEQTITVKSQIDMGTTFNFTLEKASL